MKHLMGEIFWTDRWQGSRGFLLPLEARGLYREMLTQAWRRGGRLPNDPTAIRRAVGVTIDEWRRTWPLVKKFWRVEGNWLVNDTQRAIYATTKQRIDEASARGHIGGLASAKARLNGTEQ